MPVGYRLCKARYAPDTFDKALAAGNGAAEVGGRWNRPGLKAVYTSGSIALAVLEILVHYNSELPTDMELWEVEIPTGFSSVEGLPEDWWRDGYPLRVQEMGSNWLTGKSTAALEVPSAVVRQEVNYILNPDHPAYPARHWNRIGRFDFDDRLRIGICAGDTTRLSRQGAEFAEVR